MKHTSETNATTWTDQIWPGNPSLNLLASCKLFKNPFNGRSTPVWVFGKIDFSFCVSAGASSEYSYSGFLGKAVANMDAAKEAIDAKYAEGRLIY